MAIIPDELTLSTKLENAICHDPIRRALIIGAQYGGRRLRSTIDEQKHTKTAPWRKHKLKPER